MRKLIAISVFSISINSFSSDLFLSDAQKLSGELKTNLQKQLQVKIAKDGIIGAIPFCHANVGSIAKSAAGEEMIKKYEFGRTSHLIRNSKNKPAPWMEKYLTDFKGKTKEQIQQPYLIHTLDSGKRVYLEPLFVGPLCLQCHGDRVAPEVKDQISKLYPQDQATGFKLGEFRGFVWVKEK